MISLKKLLLYLTCPYQVGDIYITTKEYTNSPSDVWPWTTWERYAAGRTLVSYSSGDSDFGTLGKTGGAKTHTLTVAQIPSHQHSDAINLYAASGASLSGGLRYFCSTQGYATALKTGVTGGGQEHNNLQPYIVTYMWKRLT